MKIVFSAACLLLIVVGLIASFKYAFHFNPYVEIAFANESKQTIQKINLSQGTNQISLLNILPGEAQTIKYTNSLSGNPDCFLDVLFADGRVFNETYGSGGFGNGEEYTVTVFKDRVSLIKRRALP